MSWGHFDKICKENEMRIAVVGSREFKRLDIVETTLLFEFIHPHSTLITGGAKGVDSQAETFARQNNIAFEIIRPIDPKNKLDYLFRNVEILTKADKIIAFWDGKSTGTKFVIDYAKARKKSIKVIEAP